MTRPPPRPPRPEDAADPADAASSERWARVEPLLDAVLDLPPEQRAAYLERACADDPAVRAEVERVLRSCERAGDFLETPAAELAAPLLAASASDASDADALAPGATVGPYRVVREAGSGGMGAVYLAEREGQFRMRVALKLVRGGMRTDAVLRRFVEERQILATLDHPNIARLLDGGVTTDGLPYFAMEYVEGTPIDRFCDERRLRVEQRLRLFRDVCQAVQYAHRNLVVHRDLKPSNILVTDEGVPKLLDFGIAKLLADGAPSAAATQAGARLMTPEFASPEQVRGDPISTASDVYSLGVLLYGLLSGRSPYETTGRSPGELERRILEGVRERPSAAVARGEAGLGPRAGRPTAAEIGRARGTSAERLRRGLRGDLDTIVLAAMHPEPERRYATAEQLAADVDRYLGGMPVAARPDAPAYRARKFVGRHRAGVAAAAAALLLLVAFSVVTAVQSARIRAQAARIAAERDNAEQVTQFLVGLFDQSDPYRSETGPLTARAMLDEGARRIDRELVGQPEARARMLGAIGRAYYGLGLYEPARRRLRSSLALRRALYGAPHADVARTLALLAGVERDAGRAAVAETLYRESLAMRRRLLGDTHADVASSLSGLALALRALGRYDEAERLLREAVAIARAPGADPLPLSSTLNNLAHVLRAKGRPGDAEALHREALALRRGRLDDDHPDVMNSRVNVALVLGDQGRFGEAEPLIRAAIEAKRRRMGDDHPDVAIDIGGLAELLERKGDGAAAERAYRDALGRMRRVLPAGHERTIAPLAGLGRLLAATRRPAEAEPLLREALKVALSSSAGRGPRSAELEGELGGALSALGRPAEAEPLLVRSYESLLAAPSVDSARTRRARARLAEHHARHGGASDAARAGRGRNVRIP